MNNPKGWGERDEMGEGGGEIRGRETTKSKECFVKMCEEVWN